LHEIPKVVGLQGSGKSHFLSDFVLRTRIQESDKFRVFYVNNNELFAQGPRQYLDNELKYMVATDAEMEIIKETFLSLSDEKDIPTFLKCLMRLKKHYNSRGIKLVLVWDQINVMNRENVIKKSPNAFSVYRELIEVDYFDDRILSASNNNEDINEMKSYKKIDINPFKVFNILQFLQLIRAEAKSFKPNDVISPKDKQDEEKEEEEINDYSNELGRILWFSISEYCFFKQTFLDGNKGKTIIDNYSKNNAFSEYFKERGRWIKASEEKFRKEYVSKTKIQQYAEVLSKVVYDYEINKISDKVNRNIFILFR